MNKMYVIKEFILQIRKFILEKKKFKNSLYKYYNFWEIKDPKNVWFTKFIEFHQINPCLKKMNFISIFGSTFTHHLIPSPKFFFSGEDLESNTFPKLKNYKNILSKIDLSLGFNIEESSKNFYLPLWFLSFIEPDSTLESITKKLNNINNINYRKDGRNKFACQISRHDINGIREKIILLLKKIDNVDCAGNFMKNTDDLVNKFSDNKIAFLKNYKFNICPENSDTIGYTTEKIFDAIMAGCIPVYWSDKNLHDFGILNRNAILFYDENNPQKLFDEILKIHRNDDAYFEFISRPIFTPEAPQLIITHLTKLKNKLIEIIDSK